MFTVESGTSASAVDTTGGPDHTWDLYIPQGAKGDKGDKGDTGAKGDPGCKGDKGDKGCKGDKGDRGDTGLQGERGETGLQGIQGERGERGKTGDRGDQGIQGLTGDKGEKGDKGDTGTKGDTGERGDQGIQGERGETGLQGLQGERGERGKTGDRGDQGIQGITGDKGEKGDKGDTGAKGDTGDRGDQGIQGLTGDKGEKGDKGDSGIQGVQGVAGPAGRTGATGPQGPAGPQGPMGCGIPGPEGPQGVAGPAGSCCDPTCTNTMSQLLGDLTDKQQSVIDSSEGDETDAVVQLLTTAMLDSDDVYLPDIIMATDNSSNLYQFTSDSLINPLTNLVPLCDILAVCVSVDSTMGQWLADYTLPSYTDSSTCPSTLDKIDFFRNYLQYCCDKGLSLTVGDNHGIDSLVDIKLLEVSNGMIKFAHPFDTPERICVMTVCDISRIYYYKQTVVD